MKGIRIGRIFGIEISLHWSLLLLIVLLGWSFSGYFVNVPGINSALSWLWGFITALGIIFSILIHELSHSLAARKLKIQVRSITLILFGGVANIEREPQRPGVEFWISIAGPAASFGLVGFFWLLTHLFSFLGSGNLWVTSLIRCFGLLGSINLILAIFNLLPGFPMDGGRILRAALWKKWKNIIRATRCASKIGQGFGFVLMGFGVLQIFQGNLGGFWLIFIGWLISNLAKATYNNLITKEVLTKIKAEEILSVKFEPPFPCQSLSQETLICSKEESLETLLKKMQQSFEGLIFVVEDDKVIGNITGEQIMKEIIREKLKR